MTSNLPPVKAEYEGPACAAWEPGSGILCNHGSCWDIMGLGGWSYSQAIMRLDLDIAPVREVRERRQRKREARQ